MTIQRKLESKVKRCPFCGGFVAVKGRRAEEGFEFECECDSCGARSKTFHTVCDMYTDDIENDQAFISALHSWNRRYPNKSELRETVREILSEELSKEKAGDHNG